MSHPDDDKSSQDRTRREASDSADVTADWQLDSAAAEAATVRGSSPTHEGEQQPVSSVHGLETGSQFGEYNIVREIGRGGMGVVYEAEHGSTGRRVALKLLATHAPQSSNAAERFMREASVAASLSHARSTFIYGAGQIDGRFFITMELMPGRTLRDVLEADGPLPINRAIDYILDVLDGLEAAHKRGVVHRDVKPSNCFMGANQRVKVGDFGLSKSLETDVSLTMTGTFMGTPQFAAPEQVRGGTVDERTDVFAVGATLFYLLAGRAPFTGDAVAVIAQIVADSAPAVDELRPDVPKPLSNIVAKAMEKEPRNRYASVSQLREALLPFSTGGTSIADVGRRFAAYSIDTTAVAILAAMAGSLLGVGLVMAGAGREELESTNFAMGSQGVVLVLLLVYFSLAEWRWGCGIGKRLLGLRVLDLQGDTPSLKSTFVRAAILPVATWLPGMMLYHLIFGGDTDESSVSWRTFVAPQLQVLSCWAMCLLCLTTVRAKNGYRGLHELASGTRVTRPQTVTDSSQNEREVPVVLPTVHQLTGKRFGSFRIAGRIGTFRNSNVYKAFDDTLNRSAWLVVSDSPQEHGAARVNVTRPTRQHWLDSGSDAGVHWTAFEPVDGVPLAEWAKKRERVSSDQARQVMLGLAEELNSALEDNTVPDSLRLSHVWIDRSGQVKLLDMPIEPIAGSSKPPPTDGMTPEYNATALLRSAARLCLSEQFPAGNVVELLDQLDSRPASTSSVAWALQRLRQIVARPSTVRWDNRLGLLAISSSVEASVYGFAAMIVTFLLALSSVPTWMGLAVAMTHTLVLVGLVGYLFRGGIAFWLGKTEVRRIKGSPASPWRCAWRGVVSWSPLVLAHVGIGVFTSKLTLVESPNMDVQVGAGLIVWATFMAIHFLGALYALFRPRRGLQDLFASTYLAPR